MNRRRGSHFQAEIGSAFPFVGAMNVEKIFTEIQSMAKRARSLDDLMRQVVSHLKQSIPAYTWVGIYWLEGQELILKTFLGKPTPHTRIPLNRGICGAAASTGKTIIVPDVNADARYLACSLETRSEIVVPIQRGEEVLGEIDIDSDLPDAFHESDRQLLEQVAVLIAARA